MRLDGKAEIGLDQHEYRPPYNRDRLGSPYPQRHEPFVEITAQDDRCRILSVFCVLGPDEAVQPWEQVADGWAIETPEGRVQVRVTDGRLDAENAKTESAWGIRLGPSQ